MGDIEQCDALEERADNFPKGRCAYVKGHGGDHRFHMPGEDLSDEIRLRAALDRAQARIEELEKNYQSLCDASAIDEKEMLAKRDSVYRERDACVAVMATMARNMGWPVGIAKHPEDDINWDDAWRNIVFIEIPVAGRPRQLSWHIHDSEMPLFEHLPKYERSWDGHTTEQKYEAMAKFCQEPTR